MYCSIAISYSPSASQSTLGGNGCHYTEDPQSPQYVSHDWRFLKACRYETATPSKTPCGRRTDPAWLSTRAPARRGGQNALLCSGGVARRCEGWQCRACCPGRSGVARGARASVKDGRSAACCQQLPLQLQPCLHHLRTELSHRRRATYTIQHGAQLSLQLPSGRHHLRVK